MSAWLTSLDPSQEEVPFFDTNTTDSDSGRAAFQFSEAKLCLPSRAFGLPPYGKGWFDTLYIDDQYRLAKDSRGDILLVENVGEPDFYNPDG